MHEPYDEDDDGYDDDQYNYDDNHPYQFYFKFDVSGKPLSDWIQNLINDTLNITTNTSDFPNVLFPVNSWNPSTGKDNTYQYLGSNYQNSPVWKKQYFVIDKINNNYKLHIQNHAKHFIQQPVYYKGLFDILN